MTRSRHDRHYPEWLRSTPRTRPQPGEPGHLRSVREIADETAIIEGSDRLLAALWHSHPRIMMVAKARGRNVAKPARSYREYAR
jgi:hypothetical protein